MLLHMNASIIAISNNRMLTEASHGCIISIIKYLLLIILADTTIKFKLYPVRND